MVWLSETETSRNETNELVVPKLYTTNNDYVSFSCLALSYFKIRVKLQKKTEVSI